MPVVKTINGAVCQTEETEEEYTVMHVCMTSSETDYLHEKYPIGSKVTFSMMRNESKDWYRPEAIFDIVLFGTDAEWTKLISLADEKNYH